jgi:hypothetical protein
MHTPFLRRFRAAGALAFLATAAVAGGAGQDLTVLFVADPDLDQVFRLQDLNQDGDFDDPGDTVRFYDGQTGPFLLADPVAITADPFDQVFVGDSAAQKVYVFRDNDDNGDSNGVGESNLFFDGTAGGNASGVLMPGITSITVRILGTVWLTSANTNGSNMDSVIRLRDLNADGDANDAAEALVYYVAGPSLPLDASILTSIDIGFDGLVYVLDTGSARPRGLYRLIDLNGTSVIDTMAEVQPYWLPTQAAPAEFTSAEIGGQGEWYVLDRANQIVQVGFDVNSSSQIDPITEAAPFWAIVPNQSFYDMAVTVPGGEIFLGDISGAPDLIIDAHDQDGSGDADSTVEVFPVYDDTISAVNIDNPYSLTVDFHDHEGVGDALCTGDSPLCPCNNLGSADSGCRNSLGVGAQLLGFGTDGIANDDLLLSALFLPPNVPALLFVGTSAINNGLGSVLGDGLRCAGGSTTRLGIQFANGVGSITWGPAFAAQLGLGVGDTRYFQVWYRNNAGPCGSGYNLTNGLQVTFTQ